ncbi:MAG: glycosyltransferase family 4 protein [Actinomycetota bacterium]
MRVLFVNPSPIRGGAEQMLSTLARDLPSHGIQTSIACLAPGPYAEELVAQGADVELIDAGRMRQAHRWAGTVRSLSKLARSFDVVCSWQVKGHYYGTPAARLARKPALWWDHGIRPLRSFAGATIPAALRADLVLTSSRAAAARHRNAKAIHPGIDVAAFGSRANRSSVRESLGASDSEPLIGIIGRLQPWKGQHVFLQAAALLRANARFAIVGDAIGGFSSGYPAELRALSKELGIEDRVCFAGQRSDIADVLSTLDVFVHCSVDEPFGIVIVEALAAVVPVIATRGGGVPEIVTHEENGLLVAPRDPKMLASFMSDLLGDQSLRSRFALAGRERAERMFSSDRMVGEFASVLGSFSKVKERV